MEAINTFITERLEQRKQKNALRTLQPENSLIDFCSNDYLGFARSDKLKEIFEKQMAEHHGYMLGSTGSRLIRGNDSFTEDLEKEIADFHQSASSLLFNSGYDANSGIFSSLPQRGDTIITDEYIHASIIDGARLSHASRFVFKHNDLQNLEQKLKMATGRIYIAVESVYSMDGDEAPLAEICNLANRYGAAVIVDEAHATGIFGESGKGLVHELDLCDQVFARIITYGKGLGTHGASILCTDDLRSYLINFARSFVYTTAAPFLNHLLIKTSYEYLKSTNHQAEIHKRISYFTSNIDKNLKLVPSRSAIQVILIPGNKRAKDTADRIRMAGYDVRAILSPTVPEGAERLRICIHNHNSMDEILNLCMLLNNNYD